MRRLHLFELEDLPWFPSLLRDSMTDLLHAQLGLFRMYAPIVPRLASALRATGERSVLDLCSGGGGTMTIIQRLLDEREGCPVTVTLTDKYPNVAAFERIAHRSGGKIRYLSEPVDATCVPAHMSGFRTLFTSLHHFGHDGARRILQDAVDNRAGIAAFEFTERSVAGLFAMTLSPILTMTMTPFIRPFRWSRLLFTYPFPIIPAAYFWDGVVSNLRTYSCDELRALVASLDAPGYEWNIGQEKHGLLPVRLTYLVGYPRIVA